MDTKMQNEPPTGGNSLSEEGSDEDREYVVEKVLDRQIKKGKRSYFLKWLGFPDEDNTWEFEDCLTCPELIAEFEEGRKKKAAEDRKAKRSAGPAAKKRKSDESLIQENEPSSAIGFARNRVAEKILGATDQSGRVMFLMKWRGIEEADLVAASVANIKCPQVVIKYYEERLDWKPARELMRERAQRQDSDDDEDEPNGQEILVDVETIGEPQAESAAVLELDNY